MLLKLKRNNLAESKFNRVLIRLSCLSICYLFFAFPAYAGQLQQDTSNTGNGTELLQRLDSVRIADSLYKIKVEAELLSLKTTDNLKKAELLNELEVLKAAESKKKGDIAKAG